jgi:hypothetical protein
MRQDMAMRSAGAGADHEAARRVGEDPKTRTEGIQKSDLRGRVSFAKAVDLVLRQDPQLYEAYRKS